MDHSWIKAAIEEVGCNAAASHRTAAALWGLIEDCSAIDLVVPHHCRPRSLAGVDVHRTRHLEPDETTVWRGVRTVTPPRALTDLGAVAPQLVSDAVDAAAVSRLVTPSAACAALDRASKHRRPGLRALRSALDAWPRGVDLPDSKLEIELGRLLRRNKIRGFTFHPHIEGFEVDFAHLVRRVIIESDGYEFHSSRAAFENDRRRDSTLAAAGWLVVRVTWWQVVEQPTEVIERLRSALSVRRSRRSSPHHLTGEMPGSPG
jgi:very-short-patch-repair endonuclease